MSLKLNTASGGSITLQEADTASNLTLTLPASTGTVMVSGNMPAFSAYASAPTQSVTSATWTKVQINTELFDTNSNYDTSTYRFTPTVAGYYQINAVVASQATSATFYIATIYKNGFEYMRGNDLRGSSGFLTSASCVVSCLMYLNGSTDYVELYGYISGTSPLFNGGNTTSSLFQASMVRAA
jgi:hypothetical protein